MQNISFFSSSNWTQGNSFFHVGWNFRIRLSSYFFFAFSLSSLLGSGFLFLPIFHRSSRLADILFTDSEDVAYDLILFRAFFRWVMWQLQSISAFYKAEWLARTLKGFITSLMITKLATTAIASFKCSWSLVSNAVVISIYGIWIPVLLHRNNRTRYSRKTKAKEATVSCREKRPDFAKLRLVYKVQNAWELRPQ